MACGGQDLSGYLEPLIQHELSFLAEVDSAPDQHFYKPHVVRLKSTKLQLSNPACT